MDIFREELLGILRGNYSRFNLLGVVVPGCIPWGGFAPVVVISGGIGLVVVLPRFIPPGGTVASRGAPAIRIRIPGFFLYFFYRFIRD